MNFKMLTSTLLIIFISITIGCDLVNPLLGGGKNKTASKIDPNNMTIAIERTHGSIQGQGQSVEVNLYNSATENYQLGGFDFTFSYDASALTFQSADAGQFLTDCGWEYFTYYFQLDRNVDVTIHVQAIADINNGAGNHPDCFSADEGYSNQLCVLNFLVTNDRTFECDYAPVQFYWNNCDNNKITDASGSVTFLSDQIYIREDTTLTNLSGNIYKDTTFPTYFGANSSCDDTTNSTLRNIDFINGGVDIYCPYIIGTRGDLNLNEIAYEIADAVLYANYFVYGISVFSIHSDNQTAASDVNADGLTLTLADLVYHIRVLVGNANPYPIQAITSPNYVNGTYQHNNAGIVSIIDDINVGAVRLVVEGDITPTLLADNMSMFSNFDGTNTRILVYSIENNSFSGDFINIGNNTIVSLESADNLGNQIIPKFIKSTYELAQNYPNPFNPTTTIEFSIPVESFVTLEIRNLNNQIVSTFAGTFEAGIHAIEWDGTNFPAGYYFYTLKVNGFEDTKKMLLLK